MGSLHGFLNTCQAASVNMLPRGLFQQGETSQLVIGGVAVLKGCAARNGCYLSLEKTTKNKVMMLSESSLRSGH